MKQIIEYNKYFPKENKKNKTLIITHGIAEYSKSYHEFAETLANSGYDVITYDLRGHGKSKTARGTLKDYHELLNDLDFLVKEAYKTNDKVFLYGHSLGGVIVNLYTKLRRKTEGIIISASPIKKGFLLSFLSIFPQRFTNKIKVKTNFNDPNLAHNYHYQKDEFDLSFFYFKYINEVIIKGLKELNKGKINKDLKVLYIYSKNDKLALVKNGKILYNKTLSADKTLLVYEKSRHNLHLDIEKKRLFNDCIKWLDKH